MSKLHTAGFEIRNVRRSENITNEGLTTKILSGGHGSLRRLRINAVQAEVTLVVFTP